MSHELMMPADALARINMLFQTQQNAANATKTKDSESRSEGPSSPMTEDESTKATRPVRR